jgi:hypothetical protein
VPASMPLTGAGMRRHVQSGNHAAESFVSFIPLFDRLVDLRDLRYLECLLLSHSVRVRVNDSDYELPVALVEDYELA